jgi:hypothetical protein
MAWWLTEFIELREESVHEFGHPLVALGILRPVKADKQHTLTATVSIVSLGSSMLGYSSLVSVVGR